MHQAKHHYGAQALAKFQLLPSILGAKIPHYAPIEVKLQQSITALWPVINHTAW